MEYAARTAHQLGQVMKKPTASNSGLPNARSPPRSASLQAQVSVIGPHDAKATATTLYKALSWHSTLSWCCATALRPPPSTPRSGSHVTTSVESQVPVHRMNGELVGQWSHAANRPHQLTYADQWLASPRARPPSLSMLPLGPVGTVYRGALAERYFENLLPDSKTIRQRLRQRFAAKSDKAYDLLTEIGRDCIGAIQLTIDNEASKNVRKIEGALVDDAAIARTSAKYNQCYSTRAQGTVRGRIPNLLGRGSRRNCPHALRMGSGFDPWAPLQQPTSSSSRSARETVGSTFTPIDRKRMALCPNPNSAFGIATAKSLDGSLRGAARAGG